MAMSVSDVTMKVPESEPLSPWSGAGHVGRSEPLGARLVLECVWIGSSRMWADDSWRSLIKTPSRDGTRLATNFARKSVASLSFWGT